MFEIPVELLKNPPIAITLMSKEAIVYSIIHQKH